MKEFNTSYFTLFIKMCKEIIYEKQIWIYLLFYFF